MSTPTGSRMQPNDGQVDHLLWRLRARLVTPPPVERVEADLERLFVAAREHAHEPPVADGLADAQVRSIADAPSRRHRQLLVGVAHRVNRVAAVAVLVVAVGGGIAVANENGVTIQALFARGSQPDVTAAPPGGEDDEPAAGGETGESPAAPTGAPAPEPGGPPTESAPTTPTEPDVAEEPPADDPGVDAEPEPPAETTREPARPPSTPSVTEVVPEPPVDPGPEILAAPAPDDAVLGFGGPLACPEGDLLACVPSGLPEGDAAGDGDEEDGDGEDGDLTALDDPSKAEELAQRRSKGPAQEG